jgi:hypothetical protein
MSKDIKYLAPLDYNDLFDKKEYSCNDLEHVLYKLVSTRLGFFNFKAGFLNFISDCAKLQQKIKTYNENTDLESIKFEYIMLLNNLISNSAISLKKRHESDNSIIINFDSNFIYKNKTIENYDNLIPINLSLYDPKTGQDTLITTIPSISLYLYDNSRLDIKIIYKKMSCYDYNKRFYNKLDSSPLFEKIVHVITPGLLSRKHIHKYLNYKSYSDNHDTDSENDTKYDSDSDHESNSYSNSNVSVSVSDSNSGTKTCRDSSKEQRHSNSNSNSHRHSHSNSHSNSNSNSNSHSDTDSHSDSEEKFDNDIVISDSHVSSSRKSVKSKKSSNSSICSDKTKSSTKSKSSSITDARIVIDNNDYLFVNNEHAYKFLDSIINYDNDNEFTNNVNEIRQVINKIDGIILSIENTYRILIQKLRAEKL